jgi:hypothetical protein
MKLANITFWISPLTHTLNMGTVNKSDAHLANEKRDVTGLMINGIAEQMLKSGNPVYTIEKDSKKYNLKIEEVLPTTKKSALTKWAEDACDNIDAGFFSGDTFQSRDAVARIEYYMGRWQREIVSIKQGLDEQEAEAK